MPTFPASITQKWLEGQLSRTHQPNVAVFAPDVGDSIRRKRYTKTFHPMSGPIFLTDEQRDTLEEFYLDDCECGALTFEWNDYRDVQRTYTWVSAPVYNRIGPDAWRAELSLLEHGLAT